MKRLAAAEKLEGLIKRARSPDELQSALTQTAAWLGFDYFAISHYISNPGRTLVVNFSSMPGMWADAVALKQHWRYCPIASACQVSLSGFAWSDLPTILDLTGEQQQMLELARVCGISEGFSVPANLPASISGSVSFALGGHKPLPADHRTALHFLALVAYEASLRVSTETHLVSRASTQLSARQLDCVLLVARGKSDWEIGHLLGISKDTAHKHIQSAMRRLGVSSRAQLSVRALFEAQISFGDVID